MSVKLRKAKVDLKFLKSNNIKDSVMFKGVNFLNPERLGRLLSLQMRMINNN